MSLLLSLKDDIRAPCSIVGLALSAQTRSTAAIRKPHYREKRLPQAFTFRVCWRTGWDGWASLKEEEQKVTRVHLRDGETLVLM